MHDPLGSQNDRSDAVAGNLLVAALGRSMAFCNAIIVVVAAIALIAAYVQGQRGHIGIEAFVGLLSPRVNRIRLWLVDVASLLFCGFFAWKSWTLAHEAWVDGQVSNSMWSPPLAIPYVLMASGMTLLCVQILLQIAIPLFSRPAPR